MTSIFATDMVPMSNGGTHLFSGDDWGRIAEQLHLSARELQIVQHIFDDEKESLIARHLGMSPHTVHTHIGRLYRKLEASSRCGLMLRVFREHLDIVERGRTHDAASLSG